MIERDRMGRVRAIRSVQTTVHGVMLVCDAWRDIAAHELLRLELEAANLLRQMEDEPFHGQLDRAVTALKKARIAVQADDTGDRLSL